MGNHFHMLLYLNKNEEIDTTRLSYNTTLTPKIINPSKQFSHLFNAYSQAFNKRYNRTGSLFEKPFERKKVGSIKYFKQLIYYIHNNPVNHGFCDILQDYPWSSYGSIISIKPTKLCREEVLRHFDNVGNFIDYHNQSHDLDIAKEWVIE
jgi:putative transposase